MAENELDGTVYHSPVEVRVTKLGTRERENLLELAKLRAPDPSIFEEQEPFFFTTRASNDGVDSYWTWMDESSLNNYAADATDPGVQFQVSHNGAGAFGGGEVGFGRSLGGEVKSRGRNSKECLIDFYTIRGLACGNVTSDGFIDGARAGIYADVSIGFQPGEMICNICGHDFLKRSFWGDSEDECTHWPGREYEIDGGKGKKTVRCILQVKNGRLHEVSLVYDGATPGAGIAAVDVARMAAANGDLAATETAVLENLYRVRIAPPSPYALGEIPVVGVTTVARTISSSTTDLALNEVRATDKDKEENPSPPAAADAEEPVIEFSEETVDDDEEPERSEVTPMERLRAKYEPKGLRLVSDDPIRTVEALADKCVEQASRIRAMSKEAEYGRQAREELLADLDTSVVRAFSADGAEDRKALYRQMVAGLDHVGIRAFIADLEDKADARLGTGGRLTEIDTTLEETIKGSDDTIASRMDKRGQTPAHLV